MKYAKCIRESQVASNREVFLSRQNEEYHVYCQGEITYSKQKTDTLCCVPINFVYDCLKYGLCIGVVELEDNLAYPCASSYTGYTKAMEKQKIGKIMNAASYEAIDYVFDEVKDKSLIRYNLLDDLPIEFQEYFHKRLCE